MEEVDLLITIKHRQKQAEMYLFQGNLTQAFYAIQSVLQVAPASAETCKILGNIQQKQGQLQEAKSSYLQAINLQPDFAVAYANLGSIYALEENWQEAIQYYQWAIQLQPNLLGVYRNLEKIWQYLGNEEELYKCRYYILIYQPDNVNYSDYAQLGQKLLKIGEKEKAIDCYHRCLAIHPEHFIVLAILGDLAKEDGDLENALKYYEKSLKNHDHPALIYAKIGDIYLKQENLCDALFYLIKSLKYRKDLLDSFRKIKIILEKQGKLKGYPVEGLEFPGKLIADFLELPENWSTQISSQSEIKHQIVYCKGFINAQPSHTVNTQQVNPILNYKKIDYTEVFLTIIPNGITWLDNFNIVFFTREQKIITDIGCGLFELIATQKLDNISYYQNNVALLSIRWGNNYFHWMFDLVIRIKLLVEAGWPLHEIDYFVVNHYQDTYRQETLSYLGIPLHKVIESNKHQCIQGEKLIVPSLTHSKPVKFSPWAIEFLRGIFMPHISISVSGYERIYISRSLATRRRIINEKEILEYLNKLGFVTVFLESKSVKEQASYFTRAKVIIAPHGAGLTNLVFCQDGTKVLEIFPSNFICNFYWQLCQACNLEHYHLVQNTDNLIPGEMNNQDFIVNINDLSSILEMAGIN